MKKIIIKKLVGCILMVLSLAMFPFLAQAGCSTPPSCADLGFSKDTTSCDSGQYILKCPSDTSKAFCVEKQTQMYVGDIYYSDGTFSRDVVSGKTAIGVVFWVSSDRDAPAGGKGLVVALEDASSTMLWDNSYVDITALTNFTSSSTALTDMDGKNNTNKIVTQRGSQAPAAQYCASYRTNGTSLGQWFLPALGQLQQLYNAKAYVNASLGLLGKGQLTNSWYWSSSEYDNSWAWRLGLSDGTVYDGNKTNDRYVRPVLAF